MLRSDLVALFCVLFFPSMLSLKLGSMNCNVYDRQLYVSPSTAQNLNTRRALADVTAATWAAVCPRAAAAAFNTAGSSAGSFL